MVTNMITPMNNNDFALQRVDSAIENMLINSALRDRRIHLCEEVTRESMFKVVYYMNRLKDIDDAEDIPMKKRKPITIVLSCYGGYVDFGLSLLSTIESFKEMGYKIITQVDSIAHSMGFMILLIGSERRGLRYARTMCHQISSGTWGTYQSQKEQLEETKRLWDCMKDIIIKNTNITLEQLDDITYRSHDWFMSMEEALKLGVIDKIV